jgi:hypothetical protein
LDDICVAGEKIRILVVCTITFTLFLSVFFLLLPSHLLLFATEVAG